MTRTRSDARGWVLPECVLGGVWLWEHLEVAFEVLDVLLALEGGSAWLRCYLCFLRCRHGWFSKHWCFVGGYERR